MKAKKQTGAAAAVTAALLSAALLITSGCASMASAEDVTEEIAWEIVDRAYEQPELFSGKTLAVYYFTDEGEKSGISDYLIDTLTSQIAQALREEELDLKVVSRQVLDRIMKELEFQLSALADEENQVRIGRQMGADIILTGTVTPINGDYRINAQLIEVESGAVLDGYLYEFWMD
ncbi:MAG: CsgG/HfaB family protein [Sediminispirochaetaceae bacterium]